MLLKFICCFLVLNSFVFGHEKSKLADFRKNVFSQWGEDGIIEKIFEIIGTKSKIAIEFGAYDGLTCSNTANFWTKDRNWQGVLIESNSNFVQQARRSVAPYNCVVINDAVGAGSDALDRVLNRNNVFVNEVDLLSIDVDGNDYHIFNSLENLHARVIICEYNPSIPAHLDVFPDYMNNLGCSVAALQRVAAKKGYSLVALTDTNAIFVTNEEFLKLAEFDTDREHLRIDRWIAYVINDYNGGYKVLGAENFANPWTWTGNKSSENYHGNVTLIPRVIIEEQNAPTVLHDIP